MKKSFFLLVVFLMFSVCQAQKKEQTTSYKTHLSKVSKDGFHSILLTPHICSFLKNDYGNIRLYDNKNEETPYVLKSEKAISQKLLFKEYITEKKEYRTAWGYTRLVIHNPAKKEIDNISLIIQNTEVTKWLKLSGSNDKKNWYVVKEKYHYRTFPNESTTSEIRIINFPLTNYEYYEILVYDYFDNPINILKTGYYDTETEVGKYSKIEKYTIKQEDNKKEKKSILKIIFPQKQYIDKFKFDIDYETFYFRNAQIKAKQNADNYQFVDNITITSNSMNEFHFSRIYTDELLVEIENNDDKPLKIKDITTSLLNTYMIASLTNKKDYYLKYGDAKLSKPVYDLQYFIDSIPHDLPQLKPTKTELVIKDDKEEKKDESKSILETYIIWIILGGVIILLGVISMKMLKDTKKKE